MWTPSVKRALVSTLAVAAALACGDSTSDPSPSGRSMVQAVDAPARDGRPVVEAITFSPGNAMPGESLHAIVEAYDPDGDPIELEYEWRVSGRRVLGEGRALVLDEDWTRKTIEVHVRASDGKLVSEPMSARVRTANRPPRVTELAVETIEGADGRGGAPHWQVRPVAEDPDGDRVDFDIEWLVNGGVVLSGKDVFDKSRVGRNDEIRVRVTANDGRVSSAPLSSAAIVMENASPRITSAPPAPESTGLFRYRPEVSDPDGDTTFTFRLLEGPEAAQFDPETGQITWKPKRSATGRHAVVIEVADAHGGRSTQSFEIAVKAAPPAAAAP